MAKKTDVARVEKGALNADQAEELFTKVDETGHTNEETAARQRRHRHETGQGVDIDPLSDADPSGSNVGKVITRTAVLFVVVFLIVVIAAQVSCGVVRRSNTADLSEAVNVDTVSRALSGGVEWGNGFTQFPEDFAVQEASENTHRVEVTVTDTTSKSALECFSGSQIQASAFSVNALLNPNIDTVVYHVNVHYDNQGKLLTSRFFGFLKPTGPQTTFMTFTWTKTTTSTGVQFNCKITGVDEATQEALKDKITTEFTPSAIISTVLGDDAETTGNQVNVVPLTDTNGDGKLDANDAVLDTNGDGVVDKKDTPIKDYTADQISEAITLEKSEPEAVAAAQTQIQAQEEAEKAEKAEKAKKKDGDSSDSTATSGSSAAASTAATATQN